MPAVVRLAGAGDPRIHDFHAVSDAVLLREKGLFVAEGRLVAGRVLEDERYKVRALLVNDAAHRALEPALGRLGPDTPVYVCATQDFRAITAFNLHRGCLALVERRAPVPFTDLLVRARTAVVLEDVTNADNVGGVFRNAAAFGADAVLLSPASCDPLYRKAIRTSMGAVLRVPWSRVAPWPRALDDFRAAGFTLAALAPDANETLERFSSRGSFDRLALILGAEGRGLSDAAEAAADHRVRIPIAAEVDSLNVGVAAGIALYTLARRAPARTA